MSWAWARLVAAFVVGAALAMPLASPAPAQPSRAPVRSFDFDRPAFETALHGKLAGTVKGYSFVLVRNGQIMAEGAGGDARNRRDGSKAMTTATPQNVGSLFKFIAGVSLLHALEAPPAGSAAGSNSFTTLLDSPFLLLMPNFWKTDIKSPAIARLSIRQLLQHKTGFRSSDMLAELRAVRPPRRQLRVYENLNFTFAGYALGAFVKPSVLSTINNFNTKAPFDERLTVSERVLGQEMDLYIRNTVMAQVPGGAVASCDAANEFRTTGAYAYKSRADGTPGVITSRKAEGKPCIGAGGYWISARHLAAFASAALHTDRLLSPAARRLMYGNGVPDDRLVWSSASSSSWTADNFGEPYIVGSGGRQNYGGGQTAGGALLRLPHNYVVVILANSPEWSSDQLSNFGFDAFRAGMAANFD